MTFLQAAQAGRRKLGSPLFWSFAGYYAIAALIFILLVLRAIPAHGGELLNLRFDPADPWAITYGPELPDRTILRCARMDPIEATLLSDGSGYLVKMWGEVLPLDLAKPSLDDGAALCAVRGTGRDKTWVPIALYLPSVRGL